MFDQQQLNISPEDISDFAEQHNLTGDYVSDQLTQKKWKVFESVGAFWGYVIRDETLSKDVVRSVAYESSDYINSFDDTENYLLYRLGATVLSTGQLVYTYGNILPRK